MHLSVAVPNRRPRGSRCGFAYLREAQNVFDDVIGARLNTVRTALNTVSDVLGLALDRAALSPQDGRAASLEPVELLTGQSAVAIGADGRGYAVTRLERRPNRDQDDALTLAGDGLQASLLGQDATSGGPTCLLGGRAGCATGALGGRCRAANRRLGGPAALSRGVSLSCGGGLLGGCLTLGSGLRGHWISVPFVGVIDVSNYCLS